MHVGCVWKNGTMTAPSDYPDDRQTSNDNVVTTWTNSWSGSGFWIFVVWAAGRMASLWVTGWRRWKAANETAGARAEAVIGLAQLSHGGRR